MIEKQSFHVDKRRVRRAFERSATEYDNVAVLQREVGARMLERLDLVRIKPAQILDVGCGTGQITCDLMRRYRNGRVIALDVAFAMLRRTRDAAGWWRKPLLLGGDAESLPLADASVDLICSSLTLHWCNDLDQTLRELRRVLAPGGLLLVTMLGPGTLKELRASWAAADDRDHVNGFIDMHDIGDAMMRAGFVDPVVDAEVLRLTYPGALALMRDLKRLGAHNSTYGRPRGLTGKDRLRRVYDAYEKFRTADGLLPASYEVIYGLAWAGFERRFVRGAQLEPREVYVPLPKVRRSTT
jgi:malonyl-CoA O-methyltransferase